MKIISDFALFVWPILFGQTNFYQMLKADTKKCYNKSLIGQMVRKEVTYTEIMRQLTRESDSSAKKIVINIDPSFDR